MGKEGFGPQGTVRPGWEGVVAGEEGGWSRCIHSQEAESDEAWSSALFLFYSVQDPGL